MPLFILLALALAACSNAGDKGLSASSNGPTPYVLTIPARFPPAQIPFDNALTLEGIDLGRRLFHDPIFSIDSTIACASCHLAAAAFADPAPQSRGVAGVTIRNSMPLFNLAWSSVFFWDGRSPSLEDQALHPVEDAIEMGERWQHVVEKLALHTEYPALFARAFGDHLPISKELATQAIAQFERTLVSANSKYDRWLRGELSLTAEEKAGFDLFFTERGDCFHCHGDPLFTDNEFHNNGLDMAPPDSGLAALSDRRADLGKFKTPSLRNIEYTAPYMHDGRFTTLEEVVEHYNAGFVRNSLTDPLLLIRPSLDLSPVQKNALVSFLKHSLTPTLSQHNTERQAAALET
ncbi:MAG: cytochrome-c peroxidase [Candidatus Latescibacterota bacterium]